MLILKDTIKKLINKVPKREVSRAIRIQRRIAICVGALLVLTFVFCYIRYGEYLYNIFCDKENLQAFLAQFGGFDRAIFVFIRAFQTVIKIIPAEPLEIAAGAFYGTFGGLFYCSLGSFLGTVAIILITKKIGKKVIDLFVPIDAINDLTIFKDSKRLYRALFFIYIIPSSPKDFIVYGATLSDNVKIPKFLVVTTIARIPNIIISTWCGSEFINGNYATALTIFLASVVLAVTLSLIYKNRSSKRKIEKGI